MFLRRALLRMPRLLGLLLALTALAGCATPAPAPPPTPGPWWFLTIRGVLGPYPTEAICEAGARAARATHEAQGPRPGQTWTIECAPQSR